MNWLDDKVIHKTQVESQIWGVKVSFDFNMRNLRCFWVSRWKGPMWNQSSGERWGFGIEMCKPKAYRR